MKNILIFGHTGTLGSELLKLLVKSEVNVTVAARSEPSEQVANIRVNLSDINDVKNIDLENYTHVIYLAQFRNYKDSSDAMYEINTISPIIIAESALALGNHFLYASSGSIYSNHSEIKSETSPLSNFKDLNAYSRSKLITEKFLEGKKNTTIIRPFYIFGEKSSNTMLIPTIFKKILETETIELPSKKGPFINPIYASDAARALMLALDNKVRVINIGGFESVHLYDLILKISKVIGLPASIKTGTGQDLSTIGDVTLLKSLGFTIDLSLDLQLQKLWTNYKNWL